MGQAQRGEDPFCAETKERERQRASVSGQYKRKTSPEWRQRNTIQGVPVYILQTALEAETWRFQKRVTFSRAKPELCVHAWGGGNKPAQSAVEISQVHWERIVPFLEYCGKVYCLPKGQKMLQVPAEGLLSAGLSGATPERGTCSAGPLKTSGLNSIQNA